MREIPLTRGKVALVDDDDYDRLIAIGKWYCGCGGYAVRSKSFRKENGLWSCKTIWMHRVILGDPEGMEVDHINRNTLDNQKSNLRVCTHKQNCINVACYAQNEYKGVSWKKQSRKWRAYSHLNHKQIHLGYFDNPIDAAKAYNEFVLKHHGEYAYLNPV